MDKIIVSNVTVILNNSDGTVLTNSTQMPSKIAIDFVAQMMCWEKEHETTYEEFNKFKEEADKHTKYREDNRNHVKVKVRK